MAIKMRQSILDNLRYDGGMTAVFRRIGCVGDSLSAGEFEHDVKGIKGFWDNYQYSYGKFMEYTLRNHVSVFARGGLTAAQLYEEADRKESPVEEINRLFDRDCLMQAYVIALGVNDLMGQGVLEKVYGGQIGEPGQDICLEDYRKNKGTFAGTYAKIIQRLQSMQPGTKFFLVSMPKENQEQCRTHLEILQKIAGVLENCYVIDLYNEAPEYNQEFKEKYFIGGHMNAMGYQLTAWYLMTYIHHIMEENYRDFQDVPFIGTEYKPATPYTRRESEIDKIINGPTA